MAETDNCVVRNEGHSRGKVGNMERHNECKNERYGNGGVQPDRSALNVLFKECEDSYVPTFDKLVADVDRKHIHSHIIFNKEKVRDLSIELGFTI